MLRLRDDLGRSSPPAPTENGTFRSCCVSADAAGTLLRRSHRPGSFTPSIHLLAALPAPLRLLPIVVVWRRPSPGRVPIVGAGSPSWWHPAQGWTSLSVPDDTQGKSDGKEGKDHPEKWAPASSLRGYCKDGLHERVPTQRDAEACSGTQSAGAPCPLSLGRYGAGMPDPAHLVKGRDQAISQTEH